VREFSSFLLLTLMSRADDAEFSFGSFAVALLELLLVYTNFLRHGKLEDSRKGDTHSLSVGDDDAGDGDCGGGGRLRRRSASDWNGVISF
jgi:hypothetical protein